MKVKISGGLKFFGNVPKNWDDILDSRENFYLHIDMIVLLKQHLLELYPT